MGSVIDSTLSAAQLLTSGHVVAIPTETVYGLAAALSQPAAIDRIFELKGRPRSNPLIVHVASVEQARHLTGEWSAAAERLAVLWPGAVTLVLPANKVLVPYSVTAGLSTVALRIPRHPVALELLQLTGPLVAPSANLSGRPSPTHVEHVLNDFGDRVPVLAAGPCEVGVESTVIDVTGEQAVCLRLGGLSLEQIQLVSGVTVCGLSNPSSTEVPKSPGMLFKHYAPKARLKLLSQGVPAPSELVISRRTLDFPDNPVWDLGETPEVAAQQLYGILRELDVKGIREAWIDDALPQSGLWLTIGERILRAASGTQASDL